MMSLRDKDNQHDTKQEVGESTKQAIPSSSRQWSSAYNKNPRIVRVSRAFGGKDRHSKVCTIKGLKDRRIRLSVPTAIQLYDLQDRLGLNQPSKVIDWLLDNTKHDIDKLPPLPIGSLSPFSQGYGASQSSYAPLLDPNFFSSKEEGINVNSQSVDVDDHEQDPSIIGKLKYWESNSMMRSKQKGVDDHHQGHEIGDSSTSSHVSAQNFFPISSSNANSILSNPMFNYYHNWDPSRSFGLSFENDHHGSQSNSSSLSSYSVAASPIFPSQTSFMNTNNDQVENHELRRFNRLHMLNSISSSYSSNRNGLGLKPFPLNINYQPHLQQNDENHESRQE